MALPASGALLAKMLKDGDALFSTRLGQYPPRQATPPFAPIIIRSDPVGDEQEMIADLRRKYPQQCKAISAPVTNIYQFFDHYDVMLKGQGFLYAVLAEIALSNAIRATNVQHFAEQWRSTHLERFLSIGPETQDIFEDEDKKLHKEDFLKDALVRLQCLRVDWPVQRSQYLETVATSGSPVQDRSLGASHDPIKPVRTLSQPLRASNYGALVQAKRYVSAPQPPPYAVPVGPARPLPQRFHTGHRGILGLPPTTPANIGHFSTPQSPITGAFLPLGHDAWNGEAPKHTFYQMAPIGPFHPDVPDTMRLRPPVPQADLNSSQLKQKESLGQEQLHPIRENRRHDTTGFRRSRGDSSSYANHHNRYRGSSKPAIGTSRFGGSGDFNPQLGAPNHTIVTEYPQERKSSITLGHSGAVGPIFYPVFQPLHFIQPGYPSDQQNPGMGNQSPASAQRTHEGHDQRFRRGSTMMKRSRMNFSNDARVLEQQDAYRRQEAYFESNQSEAPPSDLPLRLPRQDSTAQPPYSSSLGPQGAAHVGHVNYAQGVIDAGCSVQGLGSIDYAGYILKDSHESGGRLAPQNASNDVSPGGEVRSQEEEIRLAERHGFLSDTDGIPQAQSAHENETLVLKHLPATFANTADPRDAHSGSGGQGDLVLPQNHASVANRRQTSNLSNRLEQRSWDIGGQNLSQDVPHGLKFTRIWVGGLPLGVGMDEVRPLFDRYGAIADIRIVEPNPGVFATFALVTFETADAAAKAIKSAKEYRLGACQLSVRVARKQPWDDPRGSYHNSAQSPAVPRRSYIPGESIGRMQPMDGSMDTSPAALGPILGCIAHLMHSKAAHPYQINDQPHTAGLQKTPRKTAYNNSIRKENTDLTVSSAAKIQGTKVNNITDGKTSLPRSSLSSNSEQQHILPQSESQAVHATEEGVADGSPSRKKKATNTINIAFQESPADILDSSDNIALWTVVGNSQQEQEAATHQEGVIRASHGSSDRPDSTIYPNSDSTSEAVGHRASPEKGHRGSPRSKNTQNHRAENRIHSATIQRELISKSFSVDTSDNEPRGASLLKQTVARPKGTGKGQPDSGAINKYTKVKGNTFTGTSTTIDLVSVSHKEDIAGDLHQDQRTVFMKQAANGILDMIQHHGRSGDNGGPGDSTAQTAGKSQYTDINFTRPKDTTPAKAGRQNDSRKSSLNWETTEVMGGTQDGNTLKFRPTTSTSVPNTPKSKNKTVAGSQKKGTKKPSAGIPSFKTLGSGPTTVSVQRAAAVISPPKADDEFAFPPLGSSDGDKNRQDSELSADVKHYYATKHADYNIKLRDGIRALAERDADIPGAVDAGHIDVPPAISTRSRLNRKENGLNARNDALTGGTLDRAETERHNTTARSDRDGKIASSKVTFSPCDTKAQRVSPQRRRNADLVTLDPNVTSPEVLGKEQIGNDSDAWALPKGEKRWSVASAL